MSLLESSLEFYNRYGTRVINKDNKKSIISVTAAVLLVFWTRHKLTRPPKHLRHFETRFTVTDLIKSMVYGESAYEQIRRILGKDLNSKDSQDVYLRLTAIGWIVHTYNPEVTKQITMKHEKVDNPGKGFEYTLMLRFIGGPNLLLLTGDKWKKQRMLANPAFHRSMPVKLFGALALDVFDIINANPTVEFTDLMRRFTLEAIGRAGFGFEFNGLKNKDNEWIHLYEDINAGFVDPKFALPWFENSFFIRFFPKRRELHRKMDKFLVMLEEIIDSKREKISQGDVQNDALEENEKDVLTMLIEGELRGEGNMSKEDLLSNLCVFFFAGHDTTSSALSSAIYYLATNPDIQRKAREEVISILGDDPSDVFPTVADTKRLKYIDQIIKETLRIAPPVSTLAPRLTNEDIIVSSTGQVIPKGSRVAADVYALHHCENNWQECDKFNPDRFSEENTERKASTWAPFSGGPRSCIGMNFSLNEQRVFLSMLLRRYEWTLPKDSLHKEGLQVEGLIVSSPKKLEICFTKRY